jgi:RimJ/RimL family protein N-acetyltransferase
MRFLHDPAPNSLEHARQLLRDHPIADYRKFGFGRWAVILKSTGENIGFAGLKFLPELQEVDIGYRLLSEHWGKGIATEASRPAIAYGFDMLGLDQIIGLVDPENVASVNVLKKLGLIFLGMTECQNHIVAQYAIDRAAYAASSQSQRQGNKP